MTPTPGAHNEAVVTIRSRELVASVLGRVVGMLAARAQCPIDRLDDALLVTDAVAAHAAAHTRNGTLRVAVTASPEGLALHVGPLREGGAEGLVADAELPGIGNVLEHMADEVSPRPAADGEGEELFIRLSFSA